MQHPTFYSACCPLLSLLSVSLAAAGLMNTVHFSHLTPAAPRLNSVVEYGQKWQYIIVYAMPLPSREGEGELPVILGYLASCDTPHSQPTHPPTNQPSLLLQLTCRLLAASSPTQQWKCVTPFHARCRCWNQVSGMMVKMSLQLYSTNDDQYLLDFMSLPTEKKVRQLRPK